jgi:hypothetical protein
LQKRNNPFGVRNPIFYYIYGINYKAIAPISSNIFRIDIADSLANIGIGIDNVFYFNEPPSCIVNSLYRNRLGLPSFRFTTIKRVWFGLPSLSFCFLLAFFNDIWWL